MSTLTGPASGLPAFGLAPRRRAVGHRVHDRGKPARAPRPTTGSVGEQPPLHRAPKFGHRRAAGHQSSPASDAHCQPCRRALSPNCVSPAVAAPAPSIEPVGVPGVNDPSCTSADRPVVLLHGTSRRSGRLHRAGAGAAGHRPVRLRHRLRQRRPRTGAAVGGGGHRVHRPGAGRDRRRAGGRHRLLAGRAGAPHRVATDRARCRRSLSRC